MVKLNVLAESESLKQAAAPMGLGQVMGRSRFPALNEVSQNFLKIISVLSSLILIPLADGCHD